MPGAGARDAHYRVQQLDIARGIPLPDNPLLWTTIAYIVWDEVDVSPFTPGQERALVDWLHWGGQLIMSGPDSLDLLKGSFLEPYLPAKGGEPWQISTDDLAVLNRNWMIGTPRRPGAPLAPAVPWSGVRLEPAAGTGSSPPRARPTRGDVERLALFESSGGLLAERMVGRGRIVVSAMRLTERELQNWSSGFESLFNGALLRRPPRIYKPVADDGRSLFWDASADPSLADRRLDARLTTRLRYLARDLGVETHYRWDVVQPDQGATGPFGQQFWPAGGQVPSERVYRAPASAGGLGAWSEFNATAEAARAALREAAGVEVPNSTFVLFCLAIYLAVLVPLNWMFFRSLGRVEWAWIAAPLIAVAGTFAVVHLAQLDIGFVRAQTEVGLLELQPDHQRGHLSRYTALYTSLSTTYNLEFDDSTALALPFPARADYQMVRGQSHSTVDFLRQDRVRLAGLPVSSNSTGMVHSEQMFPLDGAIRLGRSSQGREQIENRSQFRLRSCAIVSKQAGELRGQWLGELMPGQSLAVSRAANLPQLAGDAPPFLAERAAENQLAVGERLNLEPMFQLVLHKDHIEEGETRLVGRLDELLPGEAVAPAASQLRTATLVVAHLEYGALPAPRPDKNTRLDVPIWQPVNNE
jgi:hypothetical protein